MMEIIIVLVAVAGFAIGAIGAMAVAGHLNRKMNASAEKEDPVPYIDVLVFKDGHEEYLVMWGEFQYFRTENLKDAKDRLEECTEAYMRTTEVNRYKYRP